MADDTGLDGFRSTRYFSRSWALLTKDRGWIKPVLLMTLALLVPIVGWLGVAGYIAEWARLTAWGVSSAPKQRGVRVGECIASGFRVAIVLLVWGVCAGLVSGVLAAIPLLGALAAFAWWLFSFFLGVVMVVAALRATIYQRIRAGLRVKTIWQMSSHDSSGLMRIVGMELVGAAVLSAIGTVVFLVFLANILPQLFYLVSYIDRYQAILSSDMQAVFVLQLLGSVLASLGPAVIVVYLVGGFVSVILSMLVATAVALWMRQFDVASWGREEDPIVIAGQSGPDDSYAVPVTPGAPDGFGQEVPRASEKVEEVAVEAEEPEVEVVEVETVAEAPDAPMEVEGAPAPESVAEPEPAPVDPSPSEDHNAEKPAE